jgi:hypothetical protein
MPRRKKPEPTPMRMPLDSDLASLGLIVGALHVGTTNDAVCDDIARRLNRVAMRNNLTIPEEVRAAWYRAALDIHRANRQLYHDVMSGAVG